MSYILDALKKSSDERQKLQKKEQQSGPVSLTMSPARKQSRRLMVLLLTIAVAGSVVLCISVWNYFETLSHESAQSVVPTSPQNNIPESAAGPEQNALDQPASESDDISKPQAAEISQSTQSFEKSTSTLPLKDELPAAVQQSLPNMKYSGHVYSPTPALRMIMINTAIIREGDTVAPDLRVIEITEDGLIMNFQGISFKVLLF